MTTKTFVSVLYFASSRAELLRVTPGLVLHVLHAKRERERERVTLPREPHYFPPQHTLWRRRFFAGLQEIFDALTHLLFSARTRVRIKQYSKHDGDDIINIWMWMTDPTQTASIYPPV